MIPNATSPRVLVDAVFFQLGRTGIARLWTTLLQQWVADGFAENVLVLDRGNTVPRVEGVRYETVAPYDYRFTGDDAYRMQALCDRENADVFISTYYTAPVTTPSVFMAYDMIPEVYGQELDALMWREKHNGVQHATAHVAISHSTARDLARFFPEIAVESVTVAYPGVSALFHPAAAGEVQRFRERHRIGKPYYLLAGSRDGFNGYKNALLFFQALAALPERQDFAVVCAGGDTALEAVFHPYATDVEVHLLHLDDDELRAAYSGAVALAYPSRYEGFGLPVLEAMACGCPVITCRNSSLVEVAGDATLFVPETDVAAMGNALRSVREEKIRRSLIAAGLKQAEKFSWREMANTVAAVLRRAATGRRPQRLWPQFRRYQTAEQDRPTLENELRLRDHQLGEAHKLATHLQDELTRAKELIACMEETRFWKVRTALIESKQSVLQLASRWLPRRAG